MMILRSLLFNILFYVGTALLSLILLPALLLPLLRRGACWDILGLADKFIPSPDSWYHPPNER